MERRDRTLAKDELIRVVAVALLLLSSCRSVPASVTGGPLPVGSGQAAFEGLPGKVMRVYYHRPGAFGPNSPILIVAHGVKRNADWTRDVWRDLSEQHGFLVLAPEFTKRQFPGGRSYNRGNMRTAFGDPVPQRDWSFNAIENLFDAARRWTGSTRDRYLLFGHSAGAQFVHRMVTFMPRLQLDRAVAGNAGWYTMPDRDEAYPYGLKGSGANDRQLRAAFGRQLTVILDDADNDPNHKYLHNTPAAKRQGAHRFARGLAYFDKAKTVAARLGTKFAWHREIVPGAGHSTRQILDAASRVLLDPR